MNLFSSRGFPTLKMRATLDDVIVAHNSQLYLTALMNGTSEIHQVRRWFSGYLHYVYIYTSDLVNIPAS